MTDDDAAARLGRALGGTVSSVRRLSGGASRVTSAVDLRRGDGTLVPLVLQRRRAGGSAPATGVDTEAALLRAARRAGVPVPDVVAAGGPDGLDPDWLVVTRLEGETIPRRIVHDEAYAGARVVLAAGPPGPWPGSTRCARR